jgi:hypothetical protein
MRNGTLKRNIIAVSAQPNWRPADSQVTEQRNGAANDRLGLVLDILQRLPHRTLSARRNDPAPHICQQLTKHVYVFCFLEQQ